MLIRPFADTDESAVVALWQRCGLTRPWNDPSLDIARKRKVQPELFLVAESAGHIVGTAMVGYEGHRGWINYLAVDPSVQRQGLGGRLMDQAEHLLLAAGCPKLNLQVRADNEAAVRFYEKRGYVQDAVVSLGKRLIVDAAPAGSQGSLGSKPGS
jgi:ribosomal protein S18 acetylase RimI-like enzyme